MNRYQSNKDQERLMLYRNKHFVDIKELEEQDRIRQIKNRMPEQLLNGTVSQIKISRTRSFSKTRSSFNKTYSRSTDTPKKIRGISMKLSLPRKSFIEIEKGPVTERNFNNFYIQKPNLSNTMDIGKTLSRQKYYKSDYSREVRENLTKKYEQFYFSNSMHCKVNYDKDKNEGKVFYSKRRLQDNPASDLTDAKVYKAFLHVRTKKQTPLDFSKSLGKDVPSAFDVRLLKVNENYWKNPQSQTNDTKASNLRSIKKMFRETKQIPQPVKSQVCQCVYFRRKKN